MAVINVTTPLLKGFNTTSKAYADVSTGTAWTTGNSPITLFTVTGAVLCRVYGIVGTTAFASTGSTGTLAIGIAGTTGLLIAATTANGTNLVANTPWFTTAPTILGVALSAEVLTFDMVNGANIILTIATNSMTAGSITMYCDWIPVSSGATVT
jgi:hypothetical protein